MIDPAGVSLRLRLALRAASPVMLLAVSLCVLGLATLAWVLPAREQLEAERAEARRAARLPPALPAVVPADAAQADSQANLALFYGALGQQQHLERQLKTLFALAAKSGLNLSQGEYKRGFDRNGRFATYQVNLPVKGSYAQVWQFALQALRALPHASLDEVSFRRENIGETGLEARLRLTLYLAADGAAPALAAGRAEAPR